VVKSRNRETPTNNRPDHPADGAHNRPSVSQSENRPARAARPMGTTQYPFPSTCQSNQSPEGINDAPRRPPPPTHRYRNPNLRLSSSPTPSPPSVLKQLVPLEYLENATITRREPADEQLLSLFSTMAMPLRSPSIESP
jgi:hypothetical protein